MRNFFIAIIAFVFLSGCGEKDPAKVFIGKWNIVGSPQRGIVIQEGGKGFAFGEKESSDFTWTVENDDDGISLVVDRVYGYGPLGRRGLSRIRLDESYLKSTWYRFERAK